MGVYSIRAYMLLVWLVLYGLIDYISFVCYVERIMWLVRCAWCGYMVIMMKYSIWIHITYVHGIKKAWWDHQYFSIHIAALCGLWLMKLCGPLWSTAYMICGLYGLRLMPTLRPLWSMAYDIAALVVYGLFPGGC